MEMPQELVFDPIISGEEIMRNSVVDVDTVGSVESSTIRETVDEDTVQTLYVGEHCAGEIGLLPTPQLKFV